MRSLPRNCYRWIANRRPRVGCGAALGAAAAVLAAASSAGAYSFNAQGELSFDNNAVFTESFEDFTPSTGMQVIHGNALHGNAYVRIQVDPQSQQGGYVALPAGPQPVAWRVRAFVRSASSWLPFVSITYGPGVGVPFTYASLYPTGRMTSDGWLEIESAPISIDGSRSPTAYFILSSENADLDALEVVEEPGAYKGSAACTASNTSACYPGQFCVQGYCQDGNMMVPTLPAPADVNLVVDVLESKLTLAFGGVYTRQNTLPVAIATMETMRQAQSPWAFWSALGVAISELHDAHTSPMGMPQFFARGVKALPVCFVEGDADLSHGIVPSDPDYSDVLVSHVGPQKNLGLKPGDRIVAVDGQHPLAWEESLKGLAGGGFGATDPQNHSGAAENLPTSITSYAESIQVVRCDPVAGVCSAPETIAVTDFEDDDYSVVTPVCDHRPAYHLASGNPDPVTHDFADVHYGLLADSAPGEDLYGMIWNDTDWDGVQTNPWQAAYTTFRASAKGLVLDHRRGDGGTPNGAAYLTELSLHPTTVSVWSTIGMLGLFDQPFTQADGLDLFNLWKNDASRGYVAGSTTPREDMRIAVMLARDVSGSDFFPFGVKGAINTRLFGRPTMGAFSTFIIYETPSYFFWSLASGDFINPSGTPQLGHGVQPDEIVSPAQSDLLVGKDTVYVRALNWVRCGQAVCP